MTDESLNVGEGAVDANQQVSKPIDDKTIQLLTELGGKVSQFETELRGLQGRQDKTENAFKSQFAEYDKLIKKGMSHDEAVSELENKQKDTSTLAQLQQQVADLAKRLEGQGRPTGASQEVVTAFEDLGLDIKDPRVLIEMQKPYKDADEAVAAAYRFKKSLSTTPKPTPPQAPALNGGVVKPEDVNSKIMRLSELQKLPTKNKAEIQKLTKELEAANWGG